MSTKIETTTGKLSYREKYYAKNIAQIKEKARQYYLKNREKTLQRSDSYYKNNKQKISEKRKIRYQNNKELFLLKNKEYRERDIERHKNYAQKYRKERGPEIYKAYYERNKEIIKQKSKEYSLNNREKINKRLNKKYKTNLQYYFARKYRDLIRRTLKRQNASKSVQSIELLGCSFEQFKKHIESQWQPGMSWDNYAHDGWHIDHIRPCITFDLTDPEQQKQCCHYTNLRPLWAKDNWARPTDGSDII